MFKYLSDHGLKTDNRYYVIAEIGINHGGDVDTAKMLIDSASRTGADAVKFQTYITEKRVVENSPIFDILKRCELPFSAFQELKDHSTHLGLDFFSTPFDSGSIDALSDIDVDLYKVASFDVTNHSLLRRIAATGKPVVMSVGMANLDEIRKAYDILHEKTRNVILLHCVSAYPTNSCDANLLAIKSLASEFDCVLGQSDHTPDIVVPLYAAAMGAQVLEKHYMIDQAFECVDKPVSITEDQMRHFVASLRELEKILGHGEVSLSDAQHEATQFRRTREF